MTLTDHLAYKDTRKKAQSRKPRMSADKKEHIMHLLQQLKASLPKSLDITAHTVQIVFTNDKEERVITIS